MGVFGALAANPEFWVAIVTLVSGLVALIVRYFSKRAKIRRENKKRAEDAQKEIAKQREKAREQTRKQNKAIKRADSVFKNWSDNG